MANHHALTHAAGELMRILGEARCGVRDEDALQQLDGLRPRLVLAETAMHDQCLRDLPANGEDRVQAGHRLLEDHRAVIAAHLPHLGIRQGQDIATVERDASLDPARPLGQQPHDRKRRHALARAALPDQRDRLARAHLEADMAHDAAPLSVEHEGRRQVFDLEDRRVAVMGHALTADGIGLHQAWCRGGAQ
jgi:hypothetical protein